MKRIYHGTQGMDHRFVVKRRSKPRRATAARTIQTYVRRRNARRKIYQLNKSKAIRKFNRSTGEIKFKSFTIVCPDFCLTNPGTGLQSGLGVVQSDILNGKYTECIELGFFLKSPAATGGSEIFSDELKNYCKLYKQIKIVHGSVTLLKYSTSTGDGSAATSTPPSTSIGVQGSKNYCTYLHSVIDTGQFKNVLDMVNLAVAPLQNLASQNEDEYLTNSNARLTQVSWDTKKSIKTKIIRPTKREEWSQQYQKIYDTAGTAVLVNLKMNQPWVDTKYVTQLTDTPLPPPTHPNYQSLYALGRLPPVSFYGDGFPVSLYTSGGIPAQRGVNLHKVLLSITCAFRVPTNRV